MNQKLETNVIRSTHHVVYTMEKMMSSRQRANVMLSHTSSITQYLTVRGTESLVTLALVLA